ncbi:MAG: NAD-dependent epimerase/dehydratase family protein [Fimbriimonadaceae bacterium]
MDVLVVGGTRFVGRKIVESAVARGHEVTLFNRGKTDALAFPGLETLTGDRTTDASALRGRRWDAVIDVCGYWPRAVEVVASALEDNVGRYVFVSSISVYSEASPMGLTEDSGVLLEDGDPEATELKMEMYGGLKVLCERTVERWFGDRALIVRPGLVVGPGDHSDRFTYWPRRFARTGPFLAPDCLQEPIQVIDGRDLGDFTVLATEKGLSGGYHVAGPTPPEPFGEFLRSGVEAGGGVAEPVFVPCGWLAERGVEPWTELPLISSLTGEPNPLGTVDTSKAVRAGLVQRTMRQTLEDTISWWNATREGSEPRAGLSDAKETALLEEYKAKRATV